MIIYVDVLIFINTVIDFLLLTLTQTLSATKPRFLRKLAASIVSALFSLYIFLPPQPKFIEILMRLLSSVVAVLVCFGYANIRLYLRRLFIFFAVSFIYAGIMAAIVMLFSPSVISINNGIVYFDISPIWLISLSLLFYIAIVLIKKLTGRQSEYAKECDIEFAFGNNYCTAKAMVDSGHTLNDAFSDCAVIIVDKSVAETLFGKLDTECMLSVKTPATSEISRCFRVLPVNTVSSKDLLPAVKIDAATVMCEKRKIELIKPILVISNQTLSDGYSSIISPRILE